jgi:hypothetical protein
MLTGLINTNLTKVSFPNRIGLLKGKNMLNARTYISSNAVVAIIEAVVAVAVRRAWRVSSARLT